MFFIFMFMIISIDNNVVHYGMWRFLDVFKRFFRICCIVDIYCCFLLSQENEICHETP